MPNYVDSYDVWAFSVLKECFVLLTFAIMFDWALFLYHPSLFIISETVRKAFDT